MLALGSKISKVLESKEDLLLAEKLTATCVQLYFQQATHLAPESVAFSINTKHEKDDAGAATIDVTKTAGEISTKPYSILSAKYLLRPETIERLVVAA